MQLSYAVHVKSTYTHRMFYVTRRNNKWEWEPWLMHDVVYVNPHTAKHNNTAVQSQKAVSAYFTSEQILPFGCAKQNSRFSSILGGGPRVVVSTAAFHARVWSSVPGLGDLKETKMFLPHPLVKVSIVGSLRDREVACSTSDRQGSNFESCVWRTVSSQSSHHPQEVLLAQFSLYVHKGGLKPDSFHFLIHFISRSLHCYWERNVR